MGRARQCPPFAQARGRKCGKGVGGRWEEPGNTHPSPRQEVGSVGKGWEEDGKSHAYAHPSPRRGVGRVGKDG